MLRARDMHPAFTPAQTPEGVLLRFLDRARDSLYQDAATVNRAAFMRLLETPWTDALLTTGITLPLHLWLGNVRVKLDTSGAGGGDAETFPLLLQERPSLTGTSMTQLYAVVEPRVTVASPQNLISDVLAFYPAVSERWSHVVAILFDYLPRLTVLNTVARDTDMVIDADDVLVDDMAYFMAKRGGRSAKDPIRTGDFQMAARDSRQRYMASIAERRKPKVRQIREGW